MIMARNTVQLGAETTRAGGALTPSDPLTDPPSISRRSALKKPTPFPLTDKEIARFWSHVDRSGGPDACWLWTAGKTGRSGYGAFNICRPGSTPSYFAHRVSMSLALGRSIRPDEECCHNCPSGDNPLCCNPAHLWIGTHLENIRDRDAKGRHYRAGPNKAANGEDHGRAKLTEEQVREIRSLYDAGELGYRRLAQRFGVTPMNIKAIVERRIWKEVA